MAVPCAKKLIPLIDMEKERLYKKSKKLEEWLDKIDKMDLDATQKLEQCRNKEKELNRKIKQVEDQISSIGYQRLCIDNDLYSYHLFLKQLTEQLCFVNWLSYFTHLLMRVATFNKLSSPSALCFLQLGENGSAGIILRGICLSLRLFFDLISICRGLLLELPKEMSGVIAGTGADFFLSTCLPVGLNVASSP